MDFSVLNENSFWAVPLVVAIVEAFKMSGFNHKFAPIISLVVGLGLSFVINTEVATGEIIVSGIIYGLTASGLYSSVKSTSNIRGKVPLREEKEAVVVETIEVEKPLGANSVKANSQLNVSQNISASSQPQSQSQNSQSQQKQQSQSQSQAEMPILEKPIDEVHIDEVNVNNPEIK